MLGNEANVKVLARQTAEIDAKIKSQKKLLSRRLRAMYMIGEESLARLIFSSASAPDLDQTLKYLKIISDHDFTLIKSFQKNLKSLNSKKAALDKEIRKLLQIKERIKGQEQLLTNDQNSKSVILSKLKSQKESSYKNLVKLQLNIAFFENKGRLPSPIAAELTEGYGTIVNDNYQYRLTHKGHEYSVNTPTEVKSVYDGETSFVGKVEGHGWTIVVDHGDHYYTVYSGLSRVNVREFQSIKQNQILATADNKMYFEIRHFSDAIDPKPWLAGATDETHKF
jgi:septal ring factor EnvC (AmiA/AmiB activator)